jgi:hypothetical protein
MRAALFGARSDAADRGGQAASARSFWVPSQEPSTTVIDLAAYRAAR